MGQDKWDISKDYWSSLLTVLHAIFEKHDKTSSMLSHSEISTFFDNTNQPDKSVKDYERL
jgi:hypothetical protein